MGGLEPDGGSEAVRHARLEICDVNPESAQHRPYSLLEGGQPGRRAGQQVRVRR
jgi:hypothetical protein